MVLKFNNLYSPVSLKPHDMALLRLTLCVKAGLKSSINYLQAGVFPTYYSPQSLFWPETLQPPQPMQLEQSFG